MMSNLHRTVSKTAAFCALLLALAATTRAYAQTEDGAAADAPPRLVVAPYAWAMDLSGKIGLNGIAVPLDLQSTELLRGVKRGGMGYLQWHTDKGFFYFEGLQIDFGQKDFQPLFNQSVKVSLGMSELGYGWKFDIDTDLSATGKAQLSPYLGARYVDLKVDVDGPLLHQTIKENWTDPVLGLILQAPISQRLSYVVKVDASGFGTDGNNYRSGVAILRYAFDRQWSLAAGYRISRFKTDTTGSGLAIDIKGSGPLVGLQFTD